jgi:2Fe-2S ferredoxin
MPRLIVLPHAEACPRGAEIEARAGELLCDVLLEHGVEIEHACGKSCACSTCHVIVRSGLESLEPAAELEEDLLDQAWGLTPQSRLSCQVRIAERDLVVELPRYSVNLAREHEVRRDA